MRAEVQMVQNISTSLGFESCSHCTDPYSMILWLDLRVDGCQQPLATLKSPKAFGPKRHPLNPSRHLSLQNNIE